MNNKKLVVIPRVVDLSENLQAKLIELYHVNQNTGLHHALFLLGEDIGFMKRKRKNLKKKYKKFDMLSDEIYEEIDKLEAMND